MCDQSPKLGMLPSYAIGLCPMPPRPLLKARVFRKVTLPRGWRTCLSVRGKDYEYKGELNDFAKKFHYSTRGTGGMTHNDPDNRPPRIFDTEATLHAGFGRDPYLLLPIIPPKT